MIKLFLGLTLLVSLPSYSADIESKGTCEDALSIIEHINQGIPTDFAFQIDNCVQVEERRTMKYLPFLIKDLGKFTAEISSDYFDTPCSKYYTDRFLLTNLSFQSIRDRIYPDGLTSPYLLDAIKTLGVTVNIAPGNPGVRPLLESFQFPICNE